LIYSTSAAAAPAILATDITRGFLPAAAAAAAGGANLL